MPFGGLQPIHLIAIAAVALIVFGPSRLPEIGRALGKTLREFSSATKEATQSFADEVQEPAKPTAADSSPKLVACKSCGQSIQAGKKFCPECGAEQ